MPWFYLQVRHRNRGPHHLCPTVSSGSAAPDSTEFPWDPLAAGYDSGDMTGIDMLIGLDAYWGLVKSTVVNHEGLVAQETVFGYILSGLVPGECHGANSVSHQLLCFNDIKSTLHMMWNLESISVCEKSVRLRILYWFNFETLFHSGMTGMKFACLGSLVSVSSFRTMRNWLGIG